MIIETEQYNFEESLSRIDQMLNFQIADESASVRVPILDDIPTKGGVVTNCSVLQIEMKSSPLLDVYSSLLCVYRAFLSEAVAILSSHSHCVDIIVLGTRMTAVFSTPFKYNIESLIDKAAMVNTLAQVVTKKAKGLGLPGITVRIAIDYGKAMLMRLGKFNVGEVMPSSLVWMGAPVEGASKLIDNTNHDWNIWISGVIYQNLKEEYKKFFHHEMEYEGYGADIINTYMKNWLNKQ